MSQKSANMARRLFAAAGSDERWVMGDENSLRINSQPKTQSAAAGRDERWVTGDEAQSAAEVMHKEGKKEKETFPPTPPYKEKEKREETTGSVSVSGSRVRVRVGADTFFDPALDPVTVAVAVFGGNHDDRRLWRWYLYRIGEDAFRQLAFTQWRENRSDGMPQNPPACFQRKLTATLNAQSAAGGRDGRWVMGDENSVRNNSQAKVQSAAANPGGAASSLPESTKGGAR
jgi:hypothetical protein